MQRLPTEALRKGVEEEKNSLPFPPSTKYFVLSLTQESRFRNNITQTAGQRSQGSDTNVTELSSPGPGSW